MKKSLLIKVLQSPELIKSFEGKDWNLLLRQASSAKMLTRVADSIVRADLIHAVPEKILYHINSEHIKINHLHTQVKQEVSELNQVFEKHNIEAIYLKGAAYLLADLPLAQGRFFSDIDILLKHSDIPKAEIALKCQGWKSQKTDDYDQAYYRNYMHEIPPMQNILRGTIIDIHHNILPICNDTKIDITKLSANPSTTILQGFENPYSHVLSPAAMVLHSAIHLFHEGELEQGLKGLSDLDLLLSYFEKHEIDFFQQLINLSKEVNQELALFCTWRYLAKVFNRELPSIAQSFIKNHKQHVKNLKFLDFIYINLFTAHHSSTASLKFTIAAQLAYWRGHLLRMPVRLLLPHLFKKSWLQFSGAFKKDKAKINKIDMLDPRFNQLDKD